MRNWRNYFLKLFWSRFYYFLYEKINTLKWITMFRRRQWRWLCLWSVSTVPIIVFPSNEVQACTVCRFIGSYVFIVVVLTLGTFGCVNVVEVQNNVFNMNPRVKTFVWFTIDPPIKTLKYISPGDWKKKITHIGGTISIQMC